MEGGDRSGWGCGAGKQLCSVHQVHGWLLNQACRAKSPRCYQDPGLRALTSARLKEPRRAQLLFFLLSLLSPNGNVSTQSVNFPGMSGVLIGNKPPEVISTIGGSGLAGSLKRNVFSGG